MGRILIFLLLGWEREKIPSPLIITAFPCHSYGFPKHLPFPKINYFLILGNRKPGTTFSCKKPLKVRFTPSAASNQAIFLHMPSLQLHHALHVAKSARLNVLSVILSFLVQGNTFIRLFTFCSFKETRPLFQVECSISMFKKKSPLGLYYCFPVGLLIILYRLCIVLLIATRIIALFSLSS